MTFLFFEFLGTTELLVILIAALILFGPRKLPEISRQIGKSLGEFKRASDEFRQTWENEVSREFSASDTDVSHAMLPPPVESAETQSNTIGRGALGAPPPGEPAISGPAIGTSPDPAAEEASAQSDEPETPEVETPKEPTRKRDWI